MFNCSPSLIIRSFDLKCFFILHELHRSIAEDHIELVCSRWHARQFGREERSEGMNPRFTLGFSLFLSCAVSIGLIACQKDQPFCKQNCLKIILSGKAFIAPDSSPLAKLPVEVAWYKKGLCIGCASFKVASGMTGTDGSFRLETTIDSGFFKDHFLSIRIPNDTNYLTPPGPGGALFYEYRYDEPYLLLSQQMNFAFYRKAPLTIRLFRKQSDSFDFFSVDHQFTTEFGYGDYLITGTASAKDTVLQVHTAADILTKVISKKTIIGGPSILQTDSLKCTVTGPNVVFIYY